jgi:hypothetical protein
VNGEKARTRFSSDLSNPCLFASINNVTSSSLPFSPSYLSANGVSLFAFSSSQTPQNTVCSPYASFSVMLADQASGLAWFQNMASDSVMQTHYGTFESILIDGSLHWYQIFLFFFFLILFCSPMISWDGKVTSFLGALGGCQDLVRQYLKDLNLYQSFVDRVDFEWTKAFPHIEEGLKQFSLPNTRIGANV